MAEHELLRTTETGCYEWTGSRTGSGERYGRVKINGKAVRAHRLFWAAAHGPIPERMEVMHTCDNPLCVRIDHLRLGTHAENMADMAAKGRTQDNAHHRYTHGEAHHNAKLSDAEVAEMRLEYGQGSYTQKELAQKYGVSQSLVSKILQGRNRSSGVAGDAYDDCGILDSAVERIQWTALEGARPVAPGSFRTWSRGRLPHGVEFVDATTGLHHSGDNRHVVNLWAAGGLELGLG